MFRKKGREKVCSVYNYYCLGGVIIKTFNLEPSKVVGEIKHQIKEAILDGKIKNNYDEAYEYMLKIAPDFGLRY